MIPTGIFIREFLLSRESYPFEVWRELKRVRGEKGQKVCSSQGFYRYWDLLKKLHLVEKTGKVEPSDRCEFGRVYYRIVPGAEQSLSWINPRKSLYETREKVHLAG